jgi:hypothetical protein
MSFPVDLLEQAQHLSQRESRRPRQASLRRSTSTAYYALFHLLSAEAALILCPNTNDETRTKVQRVLNHAEMKQTCGRFLQSPSTGSLASLLSASVSNDLKFVAFAFSQLQEARHSADYDLNSNWTRAKAAGYIQLAKDAFAAWHRTRKTGEANIFLLMFLMLKQLDNSR